MREKEIFPRQFVVFYKLKKTIEKVFVGFTKVLHIRYNIFTVKKLQDG